MKGESCARARRPIKRIPKFLGIGKINSPTMRRRFLRASLNVSNRDEEPFFHLSFLHFIFFAFFFFSLLGPLAQSSLEESANLKARFNPRDLVDEISPGIRLTSISREVVRCPPGRETNDLRLGVGEDVVELPKLYRRESSRRRRFIFAFVFTFVLVFSEGPRVKRAPPYFTGIGRTNSSSRV